MYYFKVNLYFNHLQFTISKFQELKSYIIEKNGQSVFDEFRISFDLMVPTRKQLINLVHDYVIETYKNNYVHEDIEEICKELIFMFPCLKVTDSAIGGIVSKCTNYF